jgi:hypothetical protein
MRFRTIIRSCALAFAALVITALPARAMPFHDVYILLDKSGSMGLTNFNAQISAIQTLINDYGGQANNPMRFSIIEFATSSNVVHSLDAPQDLPSVLNSLNSIGYSGGYTDTAGALSLMLDEHDTYSGNGNFATGIIFTDGVPYAPGGSVDVCQYENPIKSNGISMNIVGHGDGWTNNNGQDRTECLVESVDNILSKPQPLQYDTADYEYLSATTLVAMAEPGSLAVLGLGLVAMGFARRRAA